MNDLVSRLGLFGLFVAIWLAAGGSPSLLWPAGVVVVILLIVRALVYRDSKRP
ncbi:hypothetical protein ACFWY5_54755 [Nonomuraea sp. NPDC059007]|uniref:hypothetical protein n=1 Tax=Nonomuraea sp. NPDC059007 TaxID=3346692 RepID=UPI0036D0630D